MDNTNNKSTPDTVENTPPPEENTPSPEENTPPPEENTAVSAEGAPVSSEGSVKSDDVDEPNLDSMSKMINNDTTTPAESNIPEEPLSESKTGVVLSVKQKDVITKRKEIHSRMKESFKEKFGANTTAKPTMTNAAHILSLMNQAEKKARNGAEAAGAGPEEMAEVGQNARNEAYNNGISEVITGYNSAGKFTSKRSKTKRPVNYTQRVSNNSFVNRPSVSKNMKVNSSQVNSLLTSFDTMMTTAKGIIDTMGNMSKNLVRQLGKTENINGLQQTITAANNGISGSKTMMRNMNALTQPLEPLASSNTANIIGNSTSAFRNNASVDRSNASAFNSNIPGFGNNINLSAPPFKNNTLLSMSHNVSKRPNKSKRGRSRLRIRGTKKTAPPSNKYIPYVNENENKSLTSIVEETQNNLNSRSR